jgi:uncharacterized protein YyaL (SSP411 family)
MDSINNELTAYICNGDKCSEPIYGVENVQKSLIENHGILI